MKLPWHRPKGDEQRVQELLYASRERRHLHVKRAAEVLFPQKKGADVTDAPTHGGSHEQDTH